MRKSTDNGGFERAEPEDVGLSSERLGRIKTALEREIAAGMIPGAVVGITRAGRLGYLEAIGSRDPASKAPMTTDAIFSVASMTKAMVSAVIMQLMEEGHLLLSDPVSKYVPQLAELKVAVRLEPDKVETRAPERVVNRVVQREGQVDERAAGRWQLALGKEGAELIPSADGVVLDDGKLVVEGKGTPEAVRVRQAPGHHEGARQPSDAALHRRILTR